MIALARRIGKLLPPALNKLLRRVYHIFVPAPAEPMMYRVHLFAELLETTGRDTRILGIGPRDALDNKRLVALDPALLVLVDSPRSVRSRNSG